MPFIFNLDGHEFTSDDLTVEEAVRIEELMGKSWLDINPVLHGSAFRAMAITFLSTHMDRKDAIAFVGAIKLNKVLDHVRWVEEDDLPVEFEDGIPKSEEATDGTSTSGSAGPTSGSDGPPTSRASRASVTSSS
jgi:hypothetical protein